MAFFYEGNADKCTAAMGYFITPCVATLGMLLCYLLLLNLVSTPPVKQDH